MIGDAGRRSLLSSPANERVAVKGRGLIAFPANAVRGGPASNFDGFDTRRATRSSPSDSSSASTIRAEGFVRGAMGGRPAHRQAARSTVAFPQAPRSTARPRSEKSSTLLRSESRPVRSSQKHGQRHRALPPPWRSVCPPDSFRTLLGLLNAKLEEWLKRERLEMFRFRDGGFGKNRGCG